MVTSHRFGLAVLVYLSLMCGIVLAQSKGPAKAGFCLYLDFPLIDLPHALHAAEATGNFFTGYVHASMAHSLVLSIASSSA